MKTRKENNILIIELKGRLDVHLSLEVEQEVSKLINSGEKNIIFDLKEVEYLSSSGLRIFISALRKLKIVGGVLKLVSMNESVKKIFDIVDLTDLFDIQESVEKGVEQLKEKMDIV